MADFKLVDGIVFRGQSAVEGMAHKTTGQNKTDYLVTLATKITTATNNGDTVRSARYEGWETAVELL